MPTPSNPQDSIQLSTDMPVRTLLDPDDTDAPIRLELGTVNGIEIQMPVSVAGVLILTLTRAVDEINTQRAIRGSTTGLT